VPLPPFFCGQCLEKAISPHVIRHTTATHLLRAGVDINTIRAWLGHVSIDTTNVYAEVDLETKTQMLAACGSFTAGKGSTRGWRDDLSVANSQLRDRERSRVVAFGRFHVPAIC
jgi:integrase-like protein